MALLDGRIVAACLICNWTKRGMPLIGYILTEAQLKGKGMATSLTSLSLQKLASAGHKEVRAVVTEGNTPSERLMVRLGFDKVS